MEAVQNIAVGSIMIEKNNPEERTFNIEQCKSLAKSIESDGLIHYPIVMPIKDRPGIYRAVAGRGRLYACRTLLKWEAVPCRVLPEDTTEDECKAIEVAENLFRNNLNDAQFNKAMITWNRIYEAKHPAADNRSGKASPLAQRHEVNRRVAEAEAAGEVVTEEAKATIKEVVKEEAKEEAEANKPFAKAIQDMMGCSRRTAYRFAKRAAHLNEKDIDVLSKQGVKESTLDALANLEDRTLIDRAIKLIHAGTDHDEAIQVVAKAKPAKATKTTIASARQSRAKVETSDEQWLDEQCGPLRKMLHSRGKHWSAFERDAVLYRDIADALLVFRRAVKVAMIKAESNNGNGNGAFFWKLKTLIYTTHPTSWQMCTACEGTGSVKVKDDNGNEVMKPCKHCHQGGAYMAPTDYRMK